MAQRNTRHTTAYFTLVVERDGPSGPQNERDIERLVQQWEGNLSKGRTNVEIAHHDYMAYTYTNE